MSTIRDVARHANVSTGTVSNVLNGSPLVKEETRRRVMAAIEELGFHPTAAARSLSTQRTNTIGLIRTELRPHSHHIETDPIVLDLIDGIADAAVDSSIGLTFWTIPVGPQEMELYKRLVSSRQIDGLIIFALRQNDPRVTYLQDQGVSQYVIQTMQTRRPPPPGAVRPVARVYAVDPYYPPPPPVAVGVGIGVGGGRRCW